MKALKSNSVQILLIGSVVCMVMGGVFMLLQAYTDVEAPMTAVSLIGGGFLTLIGGNKLRESVQSNKGQYYDEQENRIKKVE